jgi:subtilisin family serine protease
VDGEYLVRLRDDILFEDVPAVTTQVAAVVGATVKRVWSSVIKGFFVKMTEQQAALMARSPLVRSIEENATWYSSGTVTQTNINPAICDPATTSNCTTVADDRLWHLDRMDQNTPSIDNKYTYCSTGQNVKVYVVDTGVERSHVEFGGNAAKVLDGSNTSGDMMPAWNPCRGWAVPPSGAHANLENEYYAKEVNNGHGTAVAGLIAGSRTGVAKNAIIVPVKTVRCDQNAARWWRPSQTYSTGQTVFRVALNAAQEYYIADWFVATTGGLSGGSEPNWNLNLNPAGSTQDNQVIWKHLDPGEIDVYHQDTTDKLLDGLIWVYQDSQASQGHEILSISKFVPWSEGMRKLNTSLGSKSVDDLIAMLVDSGVVVITSANNHNGNACDTSPANLSLNRPVAGDPAIDNLTRKVITVGGSMLVNRPWITNAPSGSTAADGGVNFGTTEPAYERTKSVREARWICGSGDSDFCDNTTATDTVEPARQASWLGGSNGGPCVTLFAPAKNVFVASIKASDDYRDARLRNTYASGTSFSAPIVAGLAARILENHPAYGPTEMRTELLANCESTMEDSGTSGAFPLNPKWMHRYAKQSPHRHS